MEIDTETMRPTLAGVTGGLSGPAIRPLALRCVWQVHEALPEIPIFGIGGIRTGHDAFQFILAGASAIQVGTVIFHDPGAPARISLELREVLAARGMDRLDQAIGLGHRAPDLVIPEDPEPMGAKADREPGGHLHDNDYDEPADVAEDA
jgi:dihydroorotate dehydrogenase (NAD+) catalytic subunit